MTAAHTTNFTNFTPATMKKKTAARLVATVAARHPEYGEDEVRRAFFRMLHGDGITRGVWPDRELLDP